MTDFENAWLQELDRNDLARECRLVGIEDVSKENLVKLLKIVKEGQLSFEDGVIVSKGEINWVFHLSKQSKVDTIKFLSRLTHQQFEKVEHLNYKIESLKRVIEVKDSYARFLSNNFQQTHGTDLIDNYKKINQSDLDSIEKFDSAKWEQSITSKYGKKPDLQEPEVKFEPKQEQKAIKQSPQKKRRIGII